VVVIAGVRSHYIEIWDFTDPDTGDVDSHQSDEESFRIEYVNPSPPLIMIPAKCPTALQAELEKAFVASWGNLWAAANHTRSCVEMLLDRLGEPRRLPRQQKELSLHQRIKNYTTRDAERGNALLALKWIGNAGSHADELSRDDVYQAFDILEVVLHDVFARDYSKVAQSVEAINTRRFRGTQTDNHSKQG
jgi:hypothetical protein